MGKSAVLGGRNYTTIGYKGHSTLIQLAIQPWPFVFVGIKGQNTCIFGPTSKAELPFIQF